MKSKLKQRALLKHRLIIQAAMCVEDLMLTTEKGAERRPWISIVYDHMESLFEPTRKPNARPNRLRV